VDALNSAYSSVDGVLFNKSQTTLIQYPAGNVVASYMIPDNVTNIGIDAFFSCANLTKRFGAFTAVDRVNFSINRSSEVNHCHRTTSARARMNGTVTPPA